MVAAAAARLHATGGYAVAPGGLLDCPLHTFTGLWCPFCGGLRCVAALTHGDVAAAVSFNVVAVTLLPVLAGLWLWSLVAAAREAQAPPRVTNRGWLVLLAVLLVFTVWRNVPALPLAAYLAP
ncbi:MAG: DUF2752 domain-containing protein [Lapillicoccus sp.]